MKRLTSFEGWLLWFVLTTTGLVFSLCLEIPLFGITIPIVLIGVIFMTSIYFSNDLEEIYVFKYKIIEKDGWLSSKKYEVKALQIWWLFIPYWSPIETVSNSYTTQNIFGAKSKEYYSTEVVFNSKEKALEAVESHKKEVLRKRKQFFARPEKEKTKTTYL